MKLRYLGIDPSLSRTGVCVLARNHFQALSFTPPSRCKSVRDKWSFMVHVVKSVLERDDIVVFEDFGVSARYAPSGRFVERIEICGALKYHTGGLCGFPWLSAPPTLLKSFVAGNGSARKDEVLKKAREVWKVSVANDDEADAFGLAALVRMYFDRDWMPVGKARERALQRFEAYAENSLALRQIFARSRFYDIKLS